MGVSIGTRLCYGTPLGQSDVGLRALLFGSGTLDSNVSIRKLNNRVGGNVHVCVYARIYA